MSYSELSAELIGCFDIGKISVCLDMWMREMRVGYSVSTPIQVSNLYNPSLSKLSSSTSWTESETPRAQLFHLGLTISACVCVCVKGHSSPPLGEELCPSA